MLVSAAPLLQPQLQGGQVGALRGGTEPLLLFREHQAFSLSAPVLQLTLSTYITLEEQRTLMLPMLWCTCLSALRGAGS